jgi:hypothetical protein
VMRPAMSQFAAVSRRTGRRLRCYSAMHRGPINTEAAAPDLAAQRRAGLLHFAVDSFVGGAFLTNTRYAIKKGAPEGTPYGMAVRLRLRSCGSRIGPSWRGRGSRS